MIERLSLYILFNILFFIGAVAQTQKTIISKFEEPGVIKILLLK